MHIVASVGKIVDRECKYEVFSLLDNSTGIPRHMPGMTIVTEKMVTLAILGPCFGNVYFSQYRLVVLLLERIIVY